MTWIICPKMEIPGTKVKVSQCTSCSDFPCFQIPAATGDLVREYFLPAVDDSKAENLINQKQRRKQMCPVTSVDRLGYCNASRKYCRYNTVCADEHPAAMITLVYMEKRMLIIKKVDGKITTSATSIAAYLKDQKEFADIESVTESKLGVRVVTELLPHDKKAKPMPAEIRKLQSFIMESGEISVEELLKKPVGTEAWVPDTIYKPETRLEIFKAPGSVTRKRKPTAQKPAAIPAAKG